MDKAKSSTSGKSSDAAKVEQASVHSKDTATRERINVQRVQNVLLIWLDSNIDENSTDCRNTISQLRQAMNTINTFTNGDECIQFLDTIEKEKACMVISGSLGQHVVPCVHNMSQVDSIFIFCGSKKYHEEWSKEWSKVKGVFTEITLICEALKQAAQQCEQNAISISFMATGDDISKKSLDQLDPSFMYTQILKEILLTIKFEEQHIKEFIQHCRIALVENPGELTNVDKLQRKYRNETPIWWYTYECFLYPMLNRALRLMDVDIIIKMGFFIGDLHRQIEQLHNEQFNSQKSSKTFTVYRGQGMAKDDFEKMMNTKGGLLSFNCFLSTSKNRNVSLHFAHRALTNPDLVGILFVMAIDPTKSTTPFASIIDVSYFKGKEDEVLFSMHTVFRIGEITPMGENNRIFQVELIITSDNDKDLRALTDRIREETFPDHEGWERLCLLLDQMGQFDKAEQVYEILLGQETNESEKAPIYHQLGTVKFNQGEYTQAITFYEKSMEIEEKSSRPNYHNLANTTSNLGSVYQQMGEYPQALSYHKKALQSYQKVLPPNHLHLASSYNNIGLVYNSMGEYSKALSSHEKALAIRQQSLPSNHPDLASSYNNIGSVHGQMGEYAKALPYFEKAREIQQQSLPSNHPDFAMSYSNIGNVYEYMGNNSKAHSFYGRAVDIAQISLPANHPDLKRHIENLDRIKKQL